MPHDIYSRDSTVYIVTGEDKLSTFHRAVEQSGFIPHLLNQWQASGKSKADFRIAVKPNIMTASIFQEDSPVYTDPGLVEELIRLMQAEGFTSFAVVESQNVYNYAYTGRTVPLVAAMCGYSGQGYSIVDLTEDTVPFDYGGVLGPHVAGRVWLEADYRISFAKNKSHWQCLYTACIKNVYGCLPMWDKMRHYHGKGRGGRDIEFFQATVLSAEKIPVHFGFLDAWISGDGLTGHVRDPHPNPTHTFLASDNIFALDWVVGEKMQVDPFHNYVIQEAVHRWGTIHITRVGNMTPWYPWDNVRPIVVVAFNVIEEFYHLRRFMSRAVATQMDSRFPPVGQGRWFFQITQAIVRVLEGVLTRATDPNKMRRLPR
ncbi:MAG: DUF362 domain-containing protein [Planctomycetaceae bacterium]|nr:MAG: DUF362 domain-containing protein [Planctomycetaceae bacterium]